MSLPPKGPPVGMIVGIASGAVVLLVVIVAVIMGNKGGTPDPIAKNSGSPSSNSQQANAASPGQVIEKRNALDAEMAKAADVNVRISRLQAWVPSVEATPQIQPDWDRHFQRALQDAQAALEGSSGSSREKAIAFQKLAEWAEVCKKPEAAMKIWLRCREVDENNVKANEKLGYVKYELPQGELIERANLEAGLLSDLDPYVGKWMSPREYAQAKQVEARVVAEVEAFYGKIDGDPFMAAAFQEQQRLKKLTTFANMDFEVVILKPWVVLITKEGNTLRLFNKRKEAYGQLLASL
ncbi:MAG: hypothetical protein AB7S36_21430, partial [Planctomycetota bacterium]